MGFEPGLSIVRPCDLPGLSFGARIGLCRCPAGSPACQCQAPCWEVAMRWCGGPAGRAVWICTAISVWSRSVRTVWSARRAESRARRRGCDRWRRVCWRPIGSRWRSRPAAGRSRRILEPYVDRVVVVSPDDTGISSARAKTDKLDARALAVLCWKGEIDAVWMPDERCRRSCVAGWRAASSSCTPAHAPRTRSQPCWQRRLIERPGVRGPVRRDGPPVAGGGAAARRGARIGRRRAAADRVPGLQRSRRSSS